MCFCVYVCVCVCVCVCSVCAWSFLIFVIPWTVDHQTPLSIGFSRQEYWNELSFPTPEGLHDPGNKPISLVSPALANRFFTTTSSRKPITEFSSKRVHLWPKWQQECLLPTQNNVQYEVSQTYLTEAVSAEYTASLVKT